MFSASRSREMRTSLTDVCECDAVRHGRSSAVISVNQKRPRDENGRQYLSDDSKAFVRRFVNERPAKSKGDTATTRPVVSITGMHKCRAPHVSLVEFTAAEAELSRQSASTASARRFARYLIALRP